MAALALALVFVSPPLAIGTLLPNDVPAQSGLVCPGTGAVIVSYQGETFTGFATRTSGWGLDATYEFVATSGDGDTIVGVGKVSMIDCVVAGDDGLAPMHNVQINGYSSGGGTNV